MSNDLTPLTVGTSNLASPSRRRLTACLLLAALSSVPATAFATEVTRDPTTLTTVDEPDTQPGDVTTVDDGIGPDPGDPIDPFQPADGFTAEKDPFDPADDLATDVLSTELWLTAANPWHPMAHITATRVFQWNPSPVNPFLSYKVDPSIPVSSNAELKLDIHTIAGFDYDFYFCIGSNSFGQDGGNLRITYMGEDYHSEFTPDGALDNCDAWGAVAGPAPGEEAVWKTVNLTIGAAPDDVVTWTVNAVLVVATPQD